MITNWSPEQFTAFFRATEFTEYWYKNLEDNRDTWVIQREERLQQMTEEPQTTTQAHEVESGHRTDSLKKVLEER